MTLVLIRMMTLVLMIRMMTLVLMIVTLALLKMAMCWRRITTPAAKMEDFLHDVDVIMSFLVTCLKGARREHLKMGQTGDTKLTLLRYFGFLKDASKTAHHIGRRRISQGKLQPTERNVRFHKDASETASSYIKKRRRIPKGCLQNCISLPPSGFQSI